jgi:class 3 adenylate cyclase/tetratricopeptide (TPR) repeat protein
VNCPSCRHENREGAAFCEACGTRLRRTCSGCGNELRPAARFCDGCGQPVAGAVEPAAPQPRDYTPQHLADRILTSRSALEGERKHVTVLFADVADYTALSERVDPEEMHALMDRCFQRILAQVHRYEGTVNQFTGDGVMALFGAPIALEDAPRRAVLAALGLQRALDALDAEVRARRGRRFRMRVGIHTGAVVVGRIGDDLRMDYTAVGDTTNLAARLQQSAGPGDVVISRATAALVSGFFELAELPPLQLKGVAQPVRAYRVQGERAVRGRIEAAVAGDGLTPLVGRDAELGALVGTFDAAVRGNGRAVFVVGEAGIGKSRLVYEFRKRLEGESLFWVEGRCASYARDTAFLPVIDALRRSFGIDDRDDDAAAIGRVERGVRGLAGELGWGLPFLRQLLSLPPGDPALVGMSAVSRRSETSRALHALFLEAVKRRPLVFVVEDLHWIDPASEEFLGFLSDAIPATRALFLFTHRPGYRHPFGDRSYHVRLSLQPLSGAETGRIASALLRVPSLPAPLAALIAHKSDGNPLFVEEITKSLLDEGVVRRTGDGIELAREIEDVSVPDSIQGVLMARIDRLADEPKRAIQVASVIGREFAARLLERITELGERAQAVVGELRALELIYQKTAHPELAFMFKHALTHDVAYESVLLNRRRSLHRIVGDAIEELYRERLAEHYEALAHHFTRAEEWERALDYHELAARKAADAFANQSATEHCQRALEIAERIGAPAERRIELEQLLGRIGFLASDFAVGAQALQQAADLDVPGRRAAMNRALASVGFLWAHDYERARTASDRALGEARAVGSLAAESTARSCESLLRCVLGHLDEEVFRSGVEAWEQADRSGNADAMVWSTAALNYKHVGDFRAAVGISERMLEAARGQPTLFPAMPLWVLGLALGGVGEYARAVSLFREALEVSERVGQAAIKCRLLNSLGWLFAEFGAHELASRYNRQSTELAGEMVRRELVPGAPELYANGGINLAGNHLMLGDVEAAAADLAPIAEELAAPGDPWMRWRYSMHLLDAKARVALARGDPDGALALLDRELEEAHRNRARKVEARALELRGRVLASAGEDGASEEALCGALEIARGIEYPPVTWRALSLLAELERRRGRSEAARRRGAEWRAVIGYVAARLPEDGARHFHALAERLESDPLGAYR